MSNTETDGTGITFTNAEDITSEIEALISNCTAALEELNNCGIQYTNAVDSYYFKTLLDATLLKEKMKEVVVKAVNDDIQ